MSNHNKTLAEVQPGGKVRLGDRLPPLPYPNYPVSKTGLQNNAYTASQMWDYARAALSAQPSPASSLDLEAMLAACVPGGEIADPQVIADNIRHWFAAQPSPGGQDALAEAARRVLSDIDSGDYHGEISEATYAALEAALAARQPSKQPDSVALGEATEFCIEKGDRQPVGEPVDDDWHLRGYAYASKQATTCAGCGMHKHTPLRIDAMGGHVCLTCIDQKLGALLGEFGYTTAQAVDLDELRRAVCVVGVVGQIDGHDVVRRNSVLDVIDVRRQRKADDQAVQS